MKSPNAKKDWNWLEARVRPSAPAEPLELVRQATVLFRRRGIDAPRLCAERLLAHVLNLERKDLYIRREAAVPVEATALFAELVRRRLEHEPLQYLLGHTEFWSLKILCDRRAFIPRPETEHCVEAALELARRHSHPAAADLGTGTGCIIAALATELPGADLFASDISQGALALARENLQRLGLADRVTLLEGDLARPFLDAGLAGSLDIVVCNPPYVAEADLGALQPEVRLFEPHSALRAGADGLCLYRRLLAEVPPLLKPGGALVLEIGDGQSEAIRRLANRTGWDTKGIKRDHARIERVVTLTRTRHGHV